MNFLINLPFEKISETIASLREKKGNEGTTLAWIDEAIRRGHGFLVNLQFERILVFQHMVMEGDKEALAKMEAATLVAFKYVRQNKLKEWKSRSYRFLGRLYDYKNQFTKATFAYKKALSLAHLDPEYIEKGIPRWLELEGFLSYSLIMSGRIKGGLDLAKRTYKKYNSDKEAKNLKTKDYYTWAIWKSGIPIRTVKALVEKKYVFDRSGMLAWINEAEKVVNPPSGSKIWGDFSLRRDEITSIKRRLKLD
jgi:tetratricopeptide (TPR) repeat protein